MCPGLDSVSISVLGPFSLEMSALVPRFVFLEYQNDFDRLSIFPVTVSRTLT